MFRAVCLAVLVMLGLCAPTWAQSVCKPLRGQRYSITGVGSGNLLNLRAGAGPGFDIRAALPGGSRNLSATGRVQFTRDSCARICARNQDGDGGLPSGQTADCLEKGSIWYEVRSPRGVTGWAAARFLVADPPPSVSASASPQPTRDLRLRLVCRSGQSLTVTLRAARNDALVVTGDRIDLVLPRGRSKRELDYASREFGGVSLRGSFARATWTGPGQPATLCVPQG
jgi:hypothetical protein